MGYEDSPLMRVCVCSHTVRRHEEDGGPCKAAGCDCVQVRVKKGRVAGVEVIPASTERAPVFTVGEQGPEPLAELEPLLSKPGRVTVADLRDEPVATQPDGEPAEPAEALYCPGAGGDCDRGCVVGGGCSRLDELEADPVEPVQARVVPADDARWLIERGLASPMKSTRDLAGNVQDGLDRLRRIVEEETVARLAERAHLVDRMAELEAELEAARRAFAALGGVLDQLATPDPVPVADCVPDPVPVADVVAHRCPECGEVKKDARGLGGHRYHKHGVRRGDQPA